jgi:hypothetical protein
MRKKKSSTDWVPYIGIRDMADRWESGDESEEDDEHEHGSVRSHRMSIEVGMVR